MMKNVLITGGAGFIGRAVVARCLQEQCKVTVIDNLCAGQMENLLPFLGRIKFFKADILDRSAVETVMAKSPPHTVFHLAAHHFIPYCNEHPDETLRVNVEGTHTVLAAAARHGADVAVVASSGALYPSRDDPLRENLTADPVDVYGLSKHLTEEVTRYIAGSTGLRCVAARLFNTYGPYETNPHLIPHIMECLRRGSTLQLGNIHTKRDYIYVDDVAALLSRLGQRANAPYTVVNVGTGVEYSAEEIVQTLTRLLGQEIAIEVDVTRVRTVDKLHQRASTKKLENLAGIMPVHSLHNGLAKLLAHERISQCEIGSAPEAAE